MRSLRALYRHLKRRSDRQLSLLWRRSNHKVPFTLECISFAKCAGLKEQLRNFVVPAETRL